MRPFRGGITGGLRANKVARPPAARHRQARSNAPPRSPNQAAPDAEERLAVNDMYDDVPPRRRRAADARGSAQPVDHPVLEPVVHDDVLPRRRRAAGARANALPAVRLVPDPVAHADAPPGRGRTAGARANALPVVRPVPVPGPVAHADAPPRRGRAAGARANALPVVRLVPVPGPVAHADAPPRRGRSAGARANALPAVRPAFGPVAHADAPPRRGRSAGARANAPPAGRPVPGLDMHVDAPFRRGHAEAYVAPPRRGRAAGARANSPSPRRRAASARGNAPPAVHRVADFDAHGDAPSPRRQAARTRGNAPPAVHRVADFDAYVDAHSPTRQAASARGNAPPAVRRLPAFDAHGDAPSLSHRAADAREIAMPVIHRAIPETAPINTSRDPRRTIRSDLQRVAANISAKYLTKRRLRETSLSVGNVISEKRPRESANLQNENNIVSNNQFSDNYNVHLRNFQERAHSTCHDGRPRMTDNCGNQNVNLSSGDTMDRLANILEKSWSSSQTILNTENTKLLHRMTSSKVLPKFSGDPLEWSKFKREFEMSTTLGSYSDSENLLRLCNALEGEAREAARSLFVAGNHTSDIMKTLEMRFGNSRLILRNILNEIRELPNIDSRQMSLIEFATRLKNAVIAIKSFDNHLGYLYSPELVNDLIAKLPVSMISNYVRFAAVESNDKTDRENF